MRRNKKNSPNVRCAANAAFQKAGAELITIEVCLFKIVAGALAGHADAFAVLV